MPLFSFLTFTTLFSFPHHSSSSSSSSSSPSCFLLFLFLLLLLLILFFPSRFTTLFSFPHHSSSSSSSSSYSLLPLIVCFSSPSPPFSFLLLLLLHFSSRRACDVWVCLSFLLLQSVVVSFPQPICGPRSKNGIKLMEMKIGFWNPSPIQAQALFNGGASHFDVGVAFN